MENTIASYNYLLDKTNKIIENYLHEGDGKEKLVARHVGTGKPMTFEELRQFSDRIGSATINTVLGTEHGLDFILVDDNFKIYNLSTQLTYEGLVTRLTTIEPSEDSEDSI